MNSGSRNTEKQKKEENGDCGYLDQMEREWRKDYDVEKARELSREYDDYLFSCWGPDEDDEPDEYGICRYAMIRGTDFSRADRYFDLAQEMALRYLDREFRMILRGALFWAREVVEYDCLYAGRAYDREKVERLTKEYGDCLEKEKQARKRRQEETGVQESYFKACVEVTAILRNAAGKDLQKIPERLLEFLERNCDPYYEFSVGREQMLWELDLLPETKGLLAMIYREYWCTEEERRDYDRLLAENQRKYERAEGLEESRWNDVEPEGLKGLFDD